MKFDYFTARYDKNGGFFFILKQLKITGSFFSTDISTQMLDSWNTWQINFFNIVSERLIMIFFVKKFQNFSSNGLEMAILGTQDKKMEIILWTLIFQNYLRLIINIVAWTFEELFERCSKTGEAEKN